ncbi:heparinase II/III family protein [Nonomuraea sp. B19D2]|uniref:heparinase II/III family protein n=1 Tax=Nonomuraea sp. B19D2 TaxID=3159561 RepID=UPI0032DB3B98
MTSFWRRLAVLILVSGFLAPGSPAAALSDTGFFGRWSNSAWATGPRLDYTLPGLKPVESAVKAGDYTLAKQRLLDYYRARPATAADYFSHPEGWPGAVELTPSCIWTLGDGEQYVKTVSSTRGENGDGRRHEHRHEGQVRILPDEPL